MSIINDDNRRNAIDRGLQSLYEASCKRRTFEQYGSELLWSFFLISTTSLDPHLRRQARQMGRERARQWRRDNGSLPADVDPDTLMDFLHGSAAAGKLGLKDRALDQQIKARALKFALTDFLPFNPRIEPPPTIASDRCQCGLANNRTRKTCCGCRRKLTQLNRYESAFYAFTRTYGWENFGLRLGATVADVVQWLPHLQPYNGNGEFYDTVYFVTHVVYALNHYSIYQLSRRWLKNEFNFLKENLSEAICQDDPEMVGEFLDCLKSFGLSDRHPVINSGVEYLLDRQNPDGSWGDWRSRDPYRYYHPTWTAIDGLRDYAWRGERLSLSEIKFF